MRIIIDNEEVELELPNKEVKVREVIDEVEDFLLTVGRIPNSLKINGKELTQEELLQRQEDSLAGEETLEFGASTIFDFVIEHLDGALQANQELRRQIQTFADEIHSSEKTVRAEDVVGEVNNFFQFWLRMHGLLRDQFQQLSFDGETFENHLDHMRNTLKEALQAMEGEDWVLVADLFQYEMIPLVEVIDTTLPELRQTVEKLATQERDVSVSKS